MTKYVQKSEIGFTYIVPYSVFEKITLCKRLLFPKKHNLMIVLKF